MTEGLTRSIDTITAEIVVIRENTQRVFFQAVVDIGKRLLEAKELVPQGEWLHYLESVLGYKPSTAQNYMRIAKEFGEEQLGLDGRSASDLFGQLGYSQLLPLLGLPEEDRRELADQEDLPSLSSREIDKLVSDYKAAKEASERAERLLTEHIETAEKAKKAAHAAELAKAAEEKARRAAEQRAKALEGQVSTLMQEAAHAVDQADETALAAVREQVLSEQAETVRKAEERAVQAEARLQKAANPVALRVNLLFEAVQEDVGKMVNALAELQTEQPEAYDKFHAAISAYFREWVV